jgi:hypothetical protein
MTVYVLLREDQSENGFVDASVVSLFRSWEDADASGNRALPRRAR